MKRHLLLAMVTLTAWIGFAGVANAYEWHEYDGHWYALTSDWSNWETAEQEAVSLGGHLAAINDDSENAWLTYTFRDTYTRGGLGFAWMNIAWIGYHHDASGGWRWTSGEPVTYFRHDYWWWPQGGSVAYLHLGYHPYAETWNANPWHEYAYDANPRGIIEVDRFPGAPLEVLIDIKPGSFPNSINLKSNGNVPIAVLGSPELDATAVDQGTVTFAGASPLSIGRSPEDVNGDGFPDVVLHFDTRDLNLQTSDVESCLTGETLGGRGIVGCDSVRIVK